jgi:DNA-binding LytR/AlgR family response regulator
MTWTCLAVDDEYLALNVIENFVSRVPWLELKGRCTTAMEAMEKLHDEAVDILFLDIQLPDLTGIDMLRTLTRPPVVIFTTAYAAYAVESYTVDAVDYLLKPFAFERFLTAVQKADAQLRNAAPAPALTMGEDIASVFIRTDGGDIRVAVGDILFIKGLREYALVQTTSREYLIRDSLRDIEKRFASFGFLRVHKSYIVGVRHVVVVDHTVLRVGDEVIPIGKTYRETVRTFIEQMRLG